MPSPTATAMRSPNPTNSTDRVPMSVVNTPAKSTDRNQSRSV